MSFDLRLYAGASKDNVALGFASTIHFAPGAVFQSEGRQIRHQPFGDTGPSTSLQPLGFSKRLQFAQFCVPFGES
jgi:hypothetical protein